MNEKFTIRDFIVYFLTGFLFFLVFAIVYPDFVFKNLEKNEKYLNLIGFSALPTFYIIGHLIHAIDVGVFSSLGKKAKKFNDKKNNLFSSFLHQLLNGHRIRGVLKTEWEVKLKMEKDFEDTVCFCSQSNLFSEAKYWSYLNDKFKGFVLILVVFSVSTIVRDEPCLGVILLSFAVLFRQRGRFFGIYYVNSIARIYRYLNSMENKNSNIRPLEK